jgi:hypothetical protein
MYQAANSTTIASQLHNCLLAVADSCCHHTSLHTWTPLSRPSNMPVMQEVWRGRVKQLSWLPCAYVFHNFLSDEECEHLKDLARPRLATSMVYEPENKDGQILQEEIRRSRETNLGGSEDDVVRAVEKRVAFVSMIPEGGRCCWP